MASISFCVSVFLVIPAVAQNFQPRPVEGASESEDIPDLALERDRFDPTVRVRIRFHGDSDPPGFLDMSHNFQNSLPLGFTMIADELIPATDSYGPLTEATRFRVTLTSPRGAWKGSWKTPEPSRPITGIYRSGFVDHDPTRMIIDHSESQGTDYVIELKPHQQEVFVDLRSVSECGIDEFLGMFPTGVNPLFEVEKELLARELAASQSTDRGKRLTGNLRATLHVEAYRVTSDGRKVVGAATRQIRVTHYGEISGFVHAPRRGTGGFHIFRQNHRTGGGQYVHQFTAEDLETGAARRQCPVPLMPSDSIALGPNDGAYMRFLLDAPDIDWMVMGNPNRLAPDKLAVFAVGMEHESNNGAAPRLVPTSFRGAMPLVVGVGVSVMLSKLDHQEWGSVVLGCAVLSTVAGHTVDYALTENPRILWREIKPIDIRMRSTLAIDFGDDGRAKFYLLDGEANIREFGREFVHLKPGHYTTITGPNAFQARAFDEDSLPEHIKRMRRAMKARQLARRDESRTGENPRGESPEGEGRRREVVQSELVPQEGLSADERRIRAKKILENKGCEFAETDGDIVGLNAKGNPLAPSDFQLIKQFNLEELDLSGTLFNDAQIDSIVACRNLQFLNLSGTEITDVSLPKIAELTELYFLNLEDTTVSDAGVRELAKLKKLNGLFLDGTRITDACVPTLVGMKRLEVVEAARTGVTPEGQREAKQRRSTLIILRYP
jgi:hypothetical protein